MQVSYVDKNMLEQSSTIPYSIYKENLNYTLGLTLSTPSLVSYFVDKRSSKFYNLKLSLV